MSDVGGISGAGQGMTGVQVAVEVLKRANDQSQVAVSLLEDAVALGEAIQEEGKGGSIDARA